MTDKEIIINGVDVSGCIFHSLTTMGYVGYNYCKCFECVCECHNNCYYKQRKRKEQEYEVYKMEAEEGKEINAELKAENEKLKKKQVCGLRPELKYIIDKICCKYNIEAKNYHEKIVEIINNLDKYEQVLTEIKEIAEEQIPYLDIDKAKTITEVEYDYAGKIYNLEQRMYKILQKISEVKNANI